jgi:hypothetical protein
MTTNTIANIKTRLAEVARTVANVKRAYAEAPASLPETDLPIFVSFVGPVTGFQKHGEQMGEEARTFILRMFVKAVQSGYDGDAERAVEPFVTSVRDTFLSHPALGLGTSASQIEWVTGMTWLGDGGITVLPFAGIPYLGVEYRINVSYLVPIGIANYE